MSSVGPALLATVSYAFGWYLFPRSPLRAGLVALGVSGLVILGMWLVLP